MLGWLWVDEKVYGQWFLEAEKDSCKFLFNVTKLDAQRAKPHQKSFSVLFEWLKEEILPQLQCEYLPSSMSGTKKSFPFLLPLGFSQLD